MVSRLLADLAGQVLTLGRVRVTRDALTRPTLVWKATPHAVSSFRHIEKNVAIQRTIRPTP